MATPKDVERIGQIADELFQAVQTVLKNGKPPTCAKLDQWLVELKAIELTDEHSLKCQKETLAVLEKVRSLVIRKIN